MNIYENTFDIDDYSIFSVNFHTNMSEGRLFKDSFGRVVIALNEFEFILCDTIDFDDYVFIPRLEKGFKMVIDGVDARIDGVDTETHLQNLEFWERVESEELNNF